MRLINQHIRISYPPTASEMLNYELLEFHEAAFMFSCWPDYLIQVEDDIKNEAIPRCFFYQPSPPYESREPSKWRFKPEEMGKDFMNMYMIMKSAVKDGKLVPDKIEKLGIETVYQLDKQHPNLIFGAGSITLLFSPKKLLHWALLNGITIPEDIQITIDEYVFNGKEDSKTIDNVKDKIIYQLLKEHYPQETENAYYIHELMKRFGSGNKPRAIGKNTSEFRFNKVGAPSKEEKEMYSTKAMQEIVSEDFSGIRRYNIRLLRVAMETAANILLRKYLENPLSEKVADKFLDWFMKDKVIELYRKGASRVVDNYIRMFVSSATFDFFLWLNLSNEIVFSKRFYV